MARSLKPKLTAHGSLIIIIGGAGSFFLANIILKEVLSAEHYGLYSIFVTYLSVSFMFGFLGFEQVFLRYSEQSDINVINTHPDIITWGCGIIVVSTAIASVFFYFAYPELSGNFPRALFVLFSFCNISMLFLFNIFRLNGQFISAQVLSNFWKIALMIIAVSGIIFNLNDVFIIMYLIMGIVIVSVGVALSLIIRKITFRLITNVSRKTLLRMAFNFLISICGFSLLMFGDRFIIENKFGVEEFGRYFYLTNFFLAPFAILQNYVGFKQLVFFKKNFTIETYKRNNRLTIMIGALFGLMLLTLPVINQYLGLISFDFQQYTHVIVLLVAIGVIRLHSAAITAAFEALTNLDTLRKANLIFIFFFVAVVLVSLFVLNTVESVVVAIAFTWVARSVILHRLLLNQAKYKSIDG